MELGKRVVDKELLDASGRRAGKVDDLVIDVPESDVAGARSRSPEVMAIVTGPMALSRNLPPWWQWLVRRFYRLAGIEEPQPMEVPWSAVMEIDVVVRADFDRRLAGMAVLGDEVERRLIARLPGA